MLISIFAGVDRVIAYNYIGGALHNPRRNYSSAQPYSTAQGFRPSKKFGDQSLD